MKASSWDSRRYTAATQHHCYRSVYYLSPPRRRSVELPAGGGAASPQAAVPVAGAGAGPQPQPRRGPAARTGSKSSIREFVITEKAPTRAFSWLKAATTAFTFKTLLRHYANQTARLLW